MKAAGSFSPVVCELSPYFCCNFCQPAAPSYSAPLPSLPPPPAFSHVALSGLSASSPTCSQPTRNSLSPPRCIERRLQGAAARPPGGVRAALLGCRRLREAPLIPAAAAERAGGNRAGRGKRDPGAEVAETSGRVPEPASTSRTGPRTVEGAGTGEAEIPLPCPLISTCTTIPSSPSTHIAATPPPRHLHLPPPLSDCLPAGVTRITWDLLDQAEVSGGGYRHCSRPLTQNSMMCR